MRRYKRTMRQILARVPVMPVLTVQGNSQFCR